MTTFRFVLTIVFAVLFGSAALAGNTQTEAGRLTIGNTGVLCYMQPCPWRGVIDLADAARDPLRPLWSGERVPGLIAATADIAQIVGAWEAHQCIEIEGAVVTPAIGATPPVLRVDRVVGACA